MPISGPTNVTTSQSVHSSPQVERSPQSCYARASSSPARGRPSLRAALKLGAEVHQKLSPSHRHQDGWQPTVESVRQYVSSDTSRRASASSVWRALAIFRLSLRFPAIAHCQHLGVGHFSALLGAPEAYQWALTCRAEFERWTRKRLQNEVKALKAQHAPVMLDQLTAPARTVGHHCAACGQSLV